MIAVLCQNDTCPQFVATGRRRFIGEREHDHAPWVGFCPKCREKTSLATVAVPA